MDGKGAILLIMLGIAGLATGCARTEYQYRQMPYFPVDELPRQVYVENQVHQLTTNGTIAESDRVLVEVRTIEGRQEKGRLISISESEILMSSTFYYEADGDSTAKIEKEVVIPKDEVLILKVW